MRGESLGQKTGNFYSMPLCASGAYYKYGHFAFVAGTVLDARRVKETVYIHFSEDWRETLTIAIAAYNLHKFRAAGINPLELVGKTICTSGFVKHDIGPVIEVNSPSQIEILGGLPR